MKKGIVIGGGIGGLTTAIALAKKGIEVVVYEQAFELKEVGAGIWVAPNGLKIYNELGIVNDIIAAGKVLDSINVIDTKSKIISTVDSVKIKARHSYATVAIHRATLQKLLASYIPTENIIVNKVFKSYKQTENSVIAEFEDGTFVEADFLIGADGIKSNTRKQIQKDLKLRYSGQTCWRFVTNFQLPLEDKNNMYEIWSNKKGLRAAYSKINENQIYCYITNFEKSGGKDNKETLKCDLLTLCSEFQPIIKDLINSCNVDDIIRSDLFDFKPITNWLDGKVALIGDAAHATTPNLGQGACQAIEDAYVIANELSVTSDIELALKKFQEKRIKKATEITNTSFQLAQVTNQSGIVKSIVKSIMRYTPEFVSNKQFDKIYSINYE